MEAQFFIELAFAAGFAKEATEPRHSYAPTRWLSGFAPPRSRVVPSPESRSPAVCGLFLSTCRTWPRVPCPYLATPLAASRDPPVGAAPGTASLGVPRKILSRFAAGAARWHSRGSVRAPQLSAPAC